jgi:4-hydroxybenzoate polyprenyltransferase
VSTSAGVTAAGAVLVCAVFLATVVSRMLPPGAGRRLTDETALILGFAAPALALLSPYLHHRLWPPAAVIAAGYGGFYLVRMRQLRRANRDGVRLLLGLDKDASFGEVWQHAARLEPRPVTNLGRVVIAGAAVALVVIGYMLGRSDTALVALMLGAADTTLRPAYHRALVKRVRDIAR